MNPLARLIAWRYLFSTKQRFVSLLTFVAIGGVTLGVWSLMVVLSVMQGFQKELNKRWIGLNAHLSVTKLPLQGDAYQSLLKTLATWPEIAEVNPYVEGEVILQVPGEEKTLALAAKLKGIENLSEAFLEQVQLYPKDTANWQLMAGHELLTNLGIHPDFQENLQAIYPFGEIGPTGDFVPKQKKFLVTHAFRTGLYEWDSLRVLVPLQQALSLLGDSAETGLQIQLKNLNQLSKVEKKLKTVVPHSAQVSSFAEQNRRLFAALKLERFAMTLLLILFGLVASFSITGLLLMFVDAKRRDLAILRSVGLSIKGASQIFLYLGGILGGVGAFVGGFLGIISCYLLDKFPIRLPSSYYLDTLPVQFQLSWGIIIMGVGFLLALVSSLYPVRVASRLDPLPMLREE